MNAYNNIHRKNFQGKMNESNECQNEWNRQKTILVYTYNEML